MFYFSSIQSTVLILSAPQKGFFPPYWLSVRAGKRQYSGVFFSDDSGTTCFQRFLLSPIFNPSSWMRGVRFLCWNKRNTKSEDQCGVTAEGGVCVSVCVRAASSSPPSSLAIAARLVASCPCSAPGRSSRSRSVAGADVHAPAPSTGPRPARRRCPGQSPSAWGRRRWEQGPASGGLQPRKCRRRRERTYDEYEYDVKILSKPGPSWIF